MTSGSRVLRSVPFLTALLAACASPSADDATTAESAAIGTGLVDNTCDVPHVSPDGQTALFKRCLGNQEQVIEMNLGSGATRFVKYVVKPNGIRALGAQPAYSYWVTEHADASWDITLHDASGTRTVVPTLPASLTGYAKGPPWLIGAEDSIALGRFLLLRGGGGRSLVVLDTSSASVTVFDVGSSQARLEPAPDATHALLVMDTFSTAGTSVTARRLDLTGAAPVLGAPATIASGAGRMVPGSYDGATVVVTTLASSSPGGGSAVMTVPVAGGAPTVLADGLGLVTVFGVHHGEVYWQARRGARYVLERGARGVVGATLLAESDRLLTPELSDDGNGVVFRTSRIGERETLSFVPANGSRPPVVIWDRNGDLLLEGRASGKLAYVARVGADSSVLHVDASTGAVLHEWKGLDFRELRLSADGSGGFIARSCKIGVVEGSELVWLSSADKVLVPCSFSASYPHRVYPIPGQPSALVSSEDKLVLVQP